jgi:asparagine synthase (glutamine-hydrolysing)
MCGLAGFVQMRGGGQQLALEALAGRMADALQHRGPDDKGVWADPEAGVALTDAFLSLTLRRRDTSQCFPRAGDS